MGLKKYSYDEILKCVIDLHNFIRTYDDMFADASGSCMEELTKQKQVYTKTSDAIEKQYLQNQRIAQSNSESILSRASEIQQNVMSMDSHLERVDKYYKKTKDQKETFFKDKAEKKYQNGVSDYFEILNQIQSDFARISEKYAKKILPAIINGLNFFFSKERKNDYEELIILKYGIDSFVQEMQSVIPEIKESTLSALEDEYRQRKRELDEQHCQTIDSIKSKYQRIHIEICSNLKSDVDTLFPVQAIEDMYSLTESYLSMLGKINAKGNLKDGMLFLQWIHYPLSIQNKLVSQVVNERFNPILLDGKILFPYVSWNTLYDTLFLDKNIIQSSQAYNYIYSLMFSFLSLAPVGKLQFDVFDPVNHGNSVTAFYEAKKKLPILFGSGISITKEQVASRIHELNSFVEDTIQNKLGTQYGSIFEYNQSIGQESPVIHLLVFFDFPKFLDEGILSELKNIISCGAKCAVYAIIYGSTSSENNYSSTNEYISQMMNRCLLLEQGISTAGIPISQMQMPNKEKFNLFFSKYLLQYENIQNRGMSSMGLVGKITNCQDESELLSIYQEIDADLSQLKLEMPVERWDFPEKIVIGTVEYPEDIFADTIAIKSIIEKYSVQRNRVALPLSMDLEGIGNLYLTYTDDKKDVMQNFVKNVIWCFLSTMPITKANICIFDPKNHGGSLGALMSIRDKNPALFDGSFYTSSEEIRQRLKHWNEVIDERIQKKLKGVFPNLIAYNQATPKRTEICHLLIIYDYPDEFDQQTTKYLSSILEIGVKCGIYTILCHDTNVKQSRFDSDENEVEKLKKYCSVYDFDGNQYILQPFRLPVTLQTEICFSPDEFMSQYMEIAERINKRGISIEDVLDKNYFQRYSNPVLSIPIGIGDGEKIIDLEIGGAGSSHHTLIGGGTGGGKSTLMHTIIMSAMIHYKPDDLNLYLMDFKGGVEFKIYDSYRLPHIKLLAVDAMQEFGLSILRGLIAEMERRSELCKRTTPQSSGLIAYRKNKDSSMPNMPRILVIMDEFQILYNDSTNRKVANECAQLTKRVVTEGRSYGIHLLMATQSMKILRNLPLESGTIEQMRIRIGLKCGEDDTRYLFSDAKSIDAFKKMAGPVGTAVMNHNFLEEDNIGLRVAYCSKDKQVELLSMLEEIYQNVECDCQTFEGSSKTRLLDYFHENGIRSTDELPVRIHMGDKIEVAPPFEMCIDRKTKHNLLVCGTDVDMTNNIINNYIISVLINNGSQVYCIDGDVMIGETGSDDLYSVMSSYTCRFHLAESYSDIVTAILDVNDIYQERKKKRCLSPVFVILKNLQYLELIEQMLSGERIYSDDYLDEESEADESLENEIDEEPQHEESDTSGLSPALLALMNLEKTLQRDKEASEKTKNVRTTASSSHTNQNMSEVLTHLISNGSGFGIYFVVTSTELQAIRENMRGMTNTMNKFPEIIVFSLSNEDADYLISGAQISGMPQNIVYYYDGAKNRFQFKPYISPRANELQSFLKGFSSNGKC